MHPIQRAQSELLFEEMERKDQERNEKIMVQVLVMDEMVLEMQKQTMHEMEEQLAQQILELFEQLMEDLQTLTNRIEQLNEEME